MKYLVLAVLALITNAISGQEHTFRHPEGRFVSVDGRQLWVEEKGAGEAVVLIAGGPGDSHVGMHSFDTLSAFCRLIYFDAFGRGKSDKAADPKEYSLDRDIEDLEGLRKTLKLETLDLLGHSYGGVVAQGYALRYPGRVKKLLLISTFHSYLMWQENDDNSNREIAENYPELWDTLTALRNQGFVSSDSVHRAYYGRVPYGFLYGYNPNNFLRGTDPTYPNNFNALLYYQMVGKDGDFVVGNDIGSFDYRRQLQSLKMPVYIAAGRYDGVAVPKMQVLYRQYCPQARFVMFERSGHNPQVEEKGRFYQSVKDFMGK